MANEKIQVNMTFNTKTYDKLLIKYKRYVAKCKGHIKPLATWAREALLAA